MRRILSMLVICWVIVLPGWYVSDMVYIQVIHFYRHCQIIVYCIETLIILLDSISLLPTISYNPYLK
jgi:hypothetical protein